MDLMQLLRISAILALIAGLDFIVYLIALKFNSYYRHKIPMSEILKMELEKGLEPINDNSADSSTQSGTVTPLRCHNQNRLHVIAKAPVKSESAFSLKEFGKKIFDAPEPVNNPVPAGENKGKKAAVSHKFNVDDRVELYGSKGEVAGKIISCNDKNSKSEYRYLVNWGKDGIWWVAEDQIEFAGFKGIEVSA